MGEPCPEEIKHRLLQILKTGILEIRSGAYSNDHSLCGIEANHLHNIPDLLQNFSTDVLAYYLEIEVAEYAKDKEGRFSPDMSNAWAFLNEWLRNERLKSG